MQTGCQQAAIAPQLIFITGVAGNLPHQQPSEMWHSGIMATPTDTVTPLSDLALWRISLPVERARNAESTWQQPSFLADEIFCRRSARYMPMVGLPRLASRREGARFRFLELDRSTHACRRLSRPI